MALPTLTMNSAFMQDFANAGPPCFAMGLVEVGGRRTGFLAMRPKVAIPADVRRKGFRFGHCLVGLSDEATLCQFVFEFYGFGRYLALVNPAVPMVRQILETMVDQGDYMFFSLNPDNTATAFRSDLADHNVAGMRDTLPIMLKATTTKAQYETGLRSFRRKPDPSGIVMPWICRDNPDYLDLEQNAVSMPLAR